MIQIASEPLTKNFTAHPLSRSFLISYFCYLLVLILPATILVNINYSWPNYKRLLITPALTYQAYQISCLDSNEQLIYDTNLQSGTQTKNYLANVKVGTQGQKVKIIGEVFINKTTSCSIQVYFYSKISSSVQAIVHLPLNFVAQQGYFLNKADVRGTISLKSSKPISQSSIVSLNQSKFGNYPPSFSGNFRDSGAKTVTIDSKILYEQNENTVDSLFFRFSADFQIIAQTYMQETSLIDKIRTFIPIFMYISLFMWWVVIQPLIEWMLKNRVYNAKTIVEKIKRQ